MNEEKDLLSPGSQTEAAAPEPSPPGEPSEPRPRARSASRSQQRRSQRSVFQYIAILFAAAFLLLLFTFAMERRQHELLQQQSEEQIDDLQQSVSAVQSLQKLYEENAALKEQAENLKSQLSQSERDIESLRQIISTLQINTEKNKEAMDWFWQLDEAFVRGRYSQCRNIIATMEDVTYGSPLKDFLSRESTTNNDRFSPYDRYQEICEAVN